MYDSVELGIVGSPTISPRGGDPRVRESFYYTLVFPVPSSREMPRISYGDVCEMLRGVTTGGLARENRAIDELRVAWETKFRTGTPMAQDMIPFSALQELMRDVIIARFSTLPGMFIHSRIETQGSGRILLSFRPSSALLRATAERLKLRVPASRALQIEADDSKEEGKLWGQAEAQEKIYRLFLAGKINAEDAQIFDYEDSGMWSRRLVALQRLPKIGVQTEEDVVYLPFRDLAALRYVYRQIDEGDGGNIDGSTLSPFRMVDKIRLTKALIDTEFDCDALLERGLLEHHLCSHTYRTTDVDTSLDVLQVQWGALPTLWRAFCGFRYARSTGDHLLHVRNYFGEQLALYFEFASFHTRALRTFGLLALVLVVIAMKTSRPRETEAVFCLCSCAFLGIFVRKWELQEVRLAARWSGGSSKDGDNAVNPLLQLPRPQFRGQMRRSPVTLRLEPYFPVGKYLARRLVSSLVFVSLTLELGASNAVLVASNRFQNLATKTPSRFNVALGVIALISKCATPHLARCSRALTDWENHRLQRDYDSQLTFKFAVLQSANSFGAIWGLAFLRPLRCRFGQCRYPEHTEADISSHDQAARMLLIMLGLDVILALWGLCWGGWRLLCGVVTGRREVLTETATHLRMVERVQGENIGPSATLLVSASASSTTPIGSSIEADLVLAPYDGVLFDYAQILVPLGFVAWFAPLAPLPSCLLAWLVAALQIRLDAYSLCYNTQRPFPIQTLSLGSWLGYLHILRVGAVLHSTIFMLMIFLDTTAADLDTKTFEQRVVILGALFAFVGWVSYALKDHQDLTEEHRLKVLRAKQKALESKYIGHLGTHLAASAKAALPPGRVFLNGVPRYVVTGDKGEEDAAEELRDQWRQQQIQMLGLEKRIAELRDSEDDSSTVGVLYTEVQGVNMLPIASPIQSFVQLCVQSGPVGIGTGSSQGDSMSTKSMEISKTTEQGAGNHASKPLPTQLANTSTSKKSRSPMWHESFEFPVTSLKDVLALRICDGSPMLSTMRQRRVLGRAQLEIEDVITRTSSCTNTTVSVSTVGPLVTVDAPETKPAEPVSHASSASSSSEDENEGEITSPRSSLTRSRQSISRPSSLPVDVPIATYELPLELPESLRRTKQSELAKHGPPRLALRCGIRLNELGSLLAQQRRLREKLSHLRLQEIQLSSWGGISRQLSTTQRA